MESDVENTPHVGCTWCTQTSDTERTPKPNERFHVFYMENHQRLPGEIKDLNILETALHLSTAKMSILPTPLIHLVQHPIKSPFWQLSLSFYENAMTYEEIILKARMNAGRLVLLDFRDHGMLLELKMWHYRHRRRGISHPALSPCGAGCLVAWLLLNTRFSGPCTLTPADRWTHSCAPRVSQAWEPGLTQLCASDLHIILYVNFA